MITLLILNNSGDVIYQSTQKHQPSEGSKIRYLPLLLTKDLLKANFHDRIQYLHTRNKTITFLEKHGLLYIAWTQRASIPVNLVHQHLFVIDRLLRFHFGPQWHMRVENISASRGGRYNNHHGHRRQHQEISLAQVSACIERLSLISTQPLYSPDMLCSVEQVELHDDLRNRLAQTLRQCCDMAFSFSPAPATRFTSFFATPPRIHPSSRSSSSQQHQDHHRRTNSFQYHHEGGTPVGSLMWSDAFLFAKNKIVVRCAKSEIDELMEEDLPHEVLFYLCNMAAEYADQATAREDLAGKRHVLHAPSRSQNILESSYSADSIHKPVYATSSDSTPTPQASSSEATGSQKSSVTYVYDSSSISAPFKVKEKSASSVTVASSNCSTPSLSWSSPPPLVHNQLLTRLTRRSGEHHHQQQQHHHHAPSKLHHPLIPKQVNTEENNNVDDEEEIVVEEEELPRNAKIHHSSNEQAEDEAANCLSSSLPLETGVFRGGRRRSSNNSSNTTATTKQPVLFQSSAPSSPSVRSRSQSNADRLSTKQSLRHMFSSFLHNDSSSDDGADATTANMPDNEAKIMSRWIKIGHRLVLCLILLIHLGDGLCTAIICRRDHDVITSPFFIVPDSHTIETIRDKMTNHGVARTLRTSLQEHWQDFTTFLLTKEATHFTILSFITAFPGLLHFIHLKDGVMLAPRIVDLSEFNQNHGLLLEIGEKYQQWASSSSSSSLTTNDVDNASCQQQQQPSSSFTWGWPSITKLQDLCEQMVQNESHDEERHIVQLDSTAGRGFQCAYQRGKHGDLLMALYFSFIPSNVLLDMHRRLFLDVSQRLP
ncbi:hypothetical protein BDB00DRAFT_109918 [Zychaea mexicana]|uniref:uncharacterized protein n=1 Tax=Zychaea mexicana TaxID=64656 RepID=UPI0022FE4CB1|nr:uncharacterized protein BDB00DRAFT_109918 [Zychaea mexicana]KAI9484828.1 hypothetical protein BDB00DRAFT_109918 [Zychaea mexicana]